MARPGHRQQGHGPGQADTERQRRYHSAEDQRCGQDRGAEAPADEGHACGGGQHRSRAPDGVEVTSPRLGAAEHADRHDDDEQVHRSHHDRVRCQQRQHQTQPRLAGHQPQAPAAPGQRGRVTLLRRRERGHPQPGHQQRGDQAQAGADREHAPDAAEGNQYPGQQPRSCDPHRFQPADDHVGRSQLVGGSGDGGDERRLGRAGRRNRGGRGRGGHISRQRHARDDRRGRGRHRRRLDQVTPGEQHHR